MSNPETSTWTGGVPGYSDGVLPHAYAFGIPGKGIRADRGMVPLPGANSAAGYVRMADDGVRLLCQGQTDDRAWLWSGAAWANIGVAWGPNAVIFGPDGSPVINDTAAKFQATGGLRAVVNGVVIGCTATYADPARGLYEYTEWPDIAIGQGGKDINQGAVVRFADDGILRRFQEGVIRNVRVHRVGNDFAITTLDYATAIARVTWRSLAELRALPPVVAVPPVEPPVEPPVPPHPPDPPVPPVDPPVPPVEPPIPPVNGGVMEVERGWLIGPGDKALSVDSTGLVRFNRSDLTEEDLLEATPIEGDARGRCGVRPVAHPEILLGADATVFAPSGNVCAQYYGTHGGLGNYEAWSFGQWPSGRVEAVIEYIEQGADHGRNWGAAGLTWVKQQ